MPTSKFYTKDGKVRPITASSPQRFKGRAAQIETGRHAQENIHIPDFESMQWADAGLRAEKVVEADQGPYFHPHVPADGPVRNIGDVVEVEGKKYVLTEKYKTGNEEIFVYDPIEEEVIEG